MELKNVHYTVLERPFRSLVFIIDIYFLNKGALIIGEVGFAYKRPLIQRALF